MNDTQSVVLSEQLASLRSFDGAPEHFWPEYIAAITPYCYASSALLLSIKRNDSTINCFASWPDNNPLQQHIAHLTSKIKQCLEMGEPQVCEYQFKGVASRVLLVPVPLATNDIDSILVLKLNGSSLELMMFRAGEVADIPAQYQKHLTLSQAKGDIGQYAATLDLLVLLNNDKKFLQGAMTLCNQLCLKFDADRVGLGWFKPQGIKLQAISHSDQFDKKVVAVQQLESLMEESFDQNLAIDFPGEQSSSNIRLAHRNYSREQGTNFIVSVPLRLGDKVIAVVTLERQHAAFTDAEQRYLQLLADLIVHRLSSMYHQGLWLGARIKKQLVSWGTMLVGTEHTGAKMTALGCSLLLLILCFGRWDYRVDAPMILKTDNVAVLSAPFDGYIGEVKTKLGDVVTEKLLLMQLEDSELMLEESSALADMSRYQREVEKYRATFALPDMRIAQALKQQASARLARIKHQLKKAQLLAPFNGVIVEGNWDNVRGAAIRKGDVIFKVAQLGHSYVEIKIAERDVHLLHVGAVGEIALVSLPNKKIPIKIETIYPVANENSTGSVFVARAIVEIDQPEWWRPGMTGMAKINAGERSLLWVVSHRTVEFFQMLLWS